MKKLLCATAFAAALAVPSLALAEPIRLLVAVGSKNGLAAERPLKFADSDAVRVRDVMVTLGSVKPEHATVLADPTRAQLFAAMERAKAEAQKHKTDEVTFFVYFSGHGDREALHLGDDRLLVTELSAKMNDVPASLRIAVTDACRATREKGFAADEPFAISATLVPNATGQVWLHASGDGEAAQESDELRGAIFTHAWINGLRGAADANGDARVTLDESFSFAHSQTLIRSAKSSGVLQKPEAIVSLKESAPVVLTETASRVATLSLPQGRDTHFLVFAGNAKSVVAEVWGSGERRLALRLPPGRYSVHKRVAGTAGLAQIALDEGQERKLDERDFAATPLDPIAQKGDGDPDVVRPSPAITRRNEIAVGYDTGANARTGLMHGPRATYAYALSERWALSLGGGMDFAQRAIDAREEKLTGGYGRLGVEHRLPLGSVTLRFVAGGRAGWVVQTLTNGAGDESKGAFTLGPEVALLGRLPLGGAFFADIGATGNVLFLREEGSVVPIAGANATGQLGARF